jgi:glutathione-regulated potassium-efflux system ancillary protein KefG
MSRSVLVLYAHPMHRTSRANRALRGAIEGLPGVTLHDLYERYPDFFVDVDREQQLLLEHEVIVFQHPFYWYNCPPLMKEWLDAVLVEGWAYGKGGDRLRGKCWLQAVSSGGSERRYRHGGENRFTIPELLRPFEQSAHLCGMVYLPPFITYAAGTRDDASLDAQAARFRALIEQLADGALPPAFDTILKPE